MAGTNTKQVMFVMLVKYAVCIFSKYIELCGPQIIQYSPSISIVCKYQS